MFLALVFRKLYSMPVLSASTMTVLDLVASGGVRNLNNNQLYFSCCSTQEGAKQSLRNRSLGRPAVRRSSRGTARISAMPEAKRVGDRSRAS